MENLTAKFLQQYRPFKSLVMYAGENQHESCFVESFDFDQNGRMINAHPLNLEESQELGLLLASNLERKGQCFQSKGILPTNVLQVRSGHDGHVIWYSPAQKKNLFFVKELKLESTVYPVPALLWKATTEHLEIFALKTNARPTAQTQLFKAPYFNIHAEGNVCMGTVDIQSEDEADLESFMSGWESYFFNSRFSHLLTSRSPVKSNIIQLYKRIKNSSEQFPVTELLKDSKKLKSLLS